MKIPLSPRLQACCSFIHPGQRVADIGTDHGYLGIWLLQAGIASSVIASDVVPGPLSAAKRNALKYGCSEKMEFRLSDGATRIPRDFDVMVCAGMGADTIISILSAAPWLCCSRYRLILQCQSKSSALRRYLCENSWQITQEVPVVDGRFVYTVMEVSYCETSSDTTPGQWYLPSVLLAHPGEALAAYYRRTVNGLKQAVEGRGDQADPVLRDALAELEAIPQDPAHRYLKEETL